MVVFAKLSGGGLFFSRNEEKIGQQPLHYTGKNSNDLVKLVQKMSYRQFLFKQSQLKPTTWSLSKLLLCEKKSCDYNYALLCVASQHQDTTPKIWVSTNGRISETHLMRKLAKRANFTAPSPSPLGCSPGTGIISKKRIFVFTCIEEEGIKSV